MNLREKPYNKLPLLPPKITFSEKVYRKTIAANKALAELKGASRLIPNPEIVLNSLTLREAKDSSEIENIVTTNDELYQALSADAVMSNPDVKEVLNYREALYRGNNQVLARQMITIRDILKVQEYLIGNNAGIRKQPGTALRNTKTGAVIYTPPSGKDVIEQKLKNLEKYMNTDDGVDPLIRMAIIHYQFESIHPFYDGNGRTGRILNVLFLVLNGLLDAPILYLSSYIMQHRRKYYEGLEKVRTKGDWESWILFMLDSVEQTARSTMKTVTEIGELISSESKRVKDKRPKIYSRELVELLFQQPYCRIYTLQLALDISRFTASKYLKELQKIGLVRGIKAGRDILYVNVPLFVLLQKEDTILKASRSPLRSST